MSWPGTWCCVQETLCGRTPKDVFLFSYAYCGLHVPSCTHMGTRACAGCNPYVLCAHRRKGALLHSKSCPMARKLPALPISVLNPENHVCSPLLLYKRVFINTQVIRCWLKYFCLFFSVMKISVSSLPPPHSILKQQKKLH